MTNKIFTKISLKRKDLFEKFIEVMVNGGWQLLNTDTSTKYVLFSDGISGDKHMYLEIYPFEGSDVINNATYDMRNKTRSSIADSALFRIGESYDSSTGSMSYYDGYKVLPFIQNRDNSISYSSIIWVDPNEDLDFYYYVDKDRVMFLVNPSVYRYTGKSNHFFMLGLPEESYLEEDYSGFPSNFLILGSVNMPNNAISSYPKAWIAKRPKNYVPKSSSVYSIQSYSIISPMSPNVDLKFPMSELLLGNGNEGLRCKVGGFYLVKPNSGEILDGDTIVVQTDNRVEKYRYCDVPLGYDNRSAFPVQGMAIRIE